MRVRKTLSLLALFSFGFLHYKCHLLGRWLRSCTPHFRVVARSDLLIALPDGISLATDHYLPKSKGLFPYILYSCILIYPLNSVSQWLIFTNQV